VARQGIIDFRLEGFPEVTAAVRALPQHLIGKAVRPGLRAGARVVMMRAKALAPRNTRRLAGGTWTIRRSKRKRMIGVVVRVPARAALGIRPSAAGFYPFSQEFGWRPGARAPQQGPSPYVAPTRVRRVGKWGPYWASVKRGPTQAQARNTFRQHVRKIPGTRFMRQALYGYTSMVNAAIAAEIRERVGRITPAALARRSVEFTGQEMAT